MAGLPTQGPGNFRVAPGGLETPTASVLAIAPHSCSPSTTQDRSAPTITSPARYGHLATMSRSHVSNTTLSLGTAGAPATPGKKMAWNRRKQEWMEVDDDTAATPQKGASSPSNPLSSNAYASGVSQNSGNFLTDRPITRIHAPPGGATSISFGDYTGPVAAAGAAAKAQQPLVLGTPTQPATPESTESVEDGPAPIPMMELPPAPSAVEKEEVAKEPEVVPPPAPVAAPKASSAMSANAYASGSNQNSGNFMTGRPTTRVRAPPGGASSITFG